MRNPLVLKIHKATIDPVERDRKEMELSKSRQTRRELSLDDKCKLIREKESGGKSCRESSQVYFTIGLKVGKQETAIRPCGHLGRLHLLAILNCHRHKFKLVIEHKKTNES